MPEAPRVAFCVEELAEKIKHISKDEGDGKGYDILSYDEKGEEIHIEIKTTTGNLNSSFFITENELQTIKKINNYYIYRVFNFNTKTNKGQIFIIDCQTKFENFFNIKPTVYKMTPKKLVN